MSFVVKVARFAAKYGKRAVQWVWAHKAQVISWGLTVYDIIKSLFG